MLSMSGARTPLPGTWTAQIIFSTDILISRAPAIFIALEAVRR